MQQLGGRMADYKNRKRMLEHIEKHVHYPAIGKQIVEACTNCSCVDSEADKLTLKAVMVNSRKFKSAREAERVLNL